MRTSPKLGLRIWNLLLDVYDHEQLADNWAKVDAHDHSPGRGVLVPTEGIAFEAISFPLIATSVFPEVSVAPASTVTIEAAEAKALAGGPELTVPATGEYEIGLTLTGETTQATFAHLEGYISHGAEKTAFKLFNWASETKNATVTTTNFARGELKESEKLTVWCIKEDAGHAVFSQGRIAIWRVI